MNKNSGEKQDELYALGVLAIVLCLFVWFCVFVALASDNTEQECTNLVTSRLNDMGTSLVVKNTHMLADNILMLSYGPAGTNYYNQNTFCGVSGETILYSPDPARLKVMLGK